MVFAAELRKEVNQDLSALDEQKSVHESIVQEVRTVIQQQIGLIPFEIVLLRTHSIPKTTSGKIRRSETKSSWQNDSLKVVYRSRTPLKLLAQVLEQQAESVPQTCNSAADLNSESAITNYILELLASLLGHRLEVHDCLFSHGITSLQVASFASLLQDKLGVTLTMSDLMNFQVSHLLSAVRSNLLCHLLAFLVVSVRLYKRSCLRYYLKS